MDVGVWNVIECQSNNFSRPSIDAVRLESMLWGEGVLVSFNGAQAVSAQLQLVSSPISFAIVILHLFNVSST